MSGAGPGVGMRCTCKGIRTCLLCEPGAPGKEPEVDLNWAPVIYFYCSICGDKAWQEKDHLKHEVGTALETEGNALYNSKQMFVPIKGIYVSKEAISEEDEKQIVNWIESHPWVDSQSGRRKQDFGPKVNFKRKKCKMGSFSGLPSYSKDVFERLKTAHSSVLGDFLPVEICHLEYDPSRGSAIDPHIDDTWLWGRRLVTLNYLSSTILTLTKENSNDEFEIAIEMPARSLVVLDSEARYEWLHGVKRKDIAQRRLASTWRELTPQFLPGGEAFEDVGKSLLQTASNFI